MYHLRYQCSFSQVIAMMEKHILIGFFILSAQKFISCEYISVVGSKTLRVDEYYKVAVTSHATSGENITVLVGIEGLSYDGEEYKEFRNISVAPGNTETANLDVSIVIFRLGQLYFNK